MDLILLADFSVIKPDIGLILWTSVTFLVVWFLLGRFAFRPIQNSLKDRENYIRESLNQAEAAKAEMAALKAENEVILNEAREERSKILKEAKAVKESIINEAKEKAKEEAQRIVSSAKMEIENQKMAAMIDVKNQAGMMALEIAEKVIKKQLTGDSAQEQYANSLVENINI